MCVIQVYKLPHDNLFMRIAEEGEDILNVDKAKGKFLYIDVNKASQVISLLTDTSFNLVNTFDDINKKVYKLDKAQLEYTLLYIVAGDEDLEDENGQKPKILVLYGETISGLKCRGHIS